MTINILVHITFISGVLIATFVFANFFVAVSTAPIRVLLDWVFSLNNNFLDLYLNTLLTGSVLDIRLICRGTKRTKASNI